MADNDVFKPRIDRIYCSSNVHEIWRSDNSSDGGDPNSVYIVGDLVGLDWISNVDIFGRIGPVPVGALCDCWIFVVAIPRTRQRDCKEIFLAIDTGRDYRRRPGNLPDNPVLVPQFPSG